MGQVRDHKNKNKKRLYQKEKQYVQALTLKWVTYY